MSARILLQAGSTILCRYGSVRLQDNVMQNTRQQESICCPVSLSLRCWNQQANQDGNNAMCSHVTWSIMHKTPGAGDRVAVAQSDRVPPTELHVHRTVLSHDGCNIPLSYTDQYITSTGLDDHNAMSNEGTCLHARHQDYFTNAGKLAKFRRFPFQAEWSHAMGGSLNRAIKSKELNGGLCPQGSGERTNHGQGCTPCNVADDCSHRTFSLKPQETSMVFTITIASVPDVSRSVQIGLCDRNI